MKKVLVVLLSLGLVMAFSMSAFAVTPDFYGQYYARGSYMSNPTMLDKANGNNTSFSYADQRLRLFTRLKIVEGLTFTTRTDALETMWGRDQLPTPSVASETSAKYAREYNSSNFSFEQVWVTFKTGVGSFDVGYKGGTPYGWGTKFLNAPGTAPGIVWKNTFGKVEVLAAWNKTGKYDWNTYNAATTSTTPKVSETDVDRDYYNLGVKSKFKGGDAGLLLTNFRYADKSGAAKGYKTSVFVLDPYVKMKLGPVNFEAEAYYGFGKQKNEEPNTSAATEFDYKMMGAYADAGYNMGPANMGLRFAYMSGTDVDPSKNGEVGTITSFSYSNDTSLWGEITPTILFGYGYHGLGLATGAVPTEAVDASKMDNTTLVMLYGGYDISKKLSADFKMTWAKANQDPAAGWQSKNFGTELDVKVSYKIYDKLTYNVGAAYLWTGDYFKGTSATATVSNVYYLTHYIDLRF